MSPVVFFTGLGTAIPARPDLGEVIGFQLNGLIVVGAALGLIWGMLELLGAIFRRISAAEAAAAAKVAASTPAAPAQPTAPSPAPAPAAPGSIPETDLVLIAAAVHAALGARARIIALSPRPEARDWAVEGRRAIFATHKVR